ncbi:hypothetical protein [Cytophaga sp. FL35]|uniref:hypothetical protein n=1 Tax=Cytophaga sp. FL35 TaxID=1904456 RepID=UPI00165360AD|nr:hypothetical protein [Cytophaga sp. FL35]MBC7000905.1 hypothetical protein [Cytophaga sp. FL35]
MNRFYTLVIVLIFTIGCREYKSKEVIPAVSQTSFQKAESKNDFHPQIDLILDRIHPTEVGRYNISVEIDSTLIPRLTNYPQSLEKIITDSIQLSLLNQFKTKTSEFILDTNKLNLKSQNLIRKEKTGKNTLRIIFNSFLRGSKDSLVITSIGYVYPKAGGWEEVVFFEKEDSLWKTAKRYKTVDY